jgi:hypothetical protein
MGDWEWVIGEPEIGERVMVNDGRSLNSYRPITNHPISNVSASACADRHVRAGARRRGA